MRCVPPTASTRTVDANNLDRFVRPRDSCAKRTKFLSGNGLDCAADSSKALSAHRLLLVPKAFWPHVPDEDTPSPR
eukprot:2227938-Pleurochrysis_carterae.AAC.8